jgi:mannitol 2-dehydrogenase
MVDYLFAPADPDAVLRAMSDSATRIVSLTITEGGYHLDPATGGFDDRDEALREDISALAADLEHAQPRTAFGFLVAALARRRAAGVDPFTVMSCDNIAGNGEVARTALLAVASRCDEDLAAWIEQHVPCPSSMVDRITPATTDDDRDALAEQFGVRDRWPVVCESFTQWALEDHFVAGRPRWEDAGVEVVDDVEAHELMKLRLLNGGHQVIAYLGILAGFTYAHEVAQDELVAGFLRDWMDAEVTPTLTAPDGVDLDSYKDTLVERFANPEVRDTLARLAAYSSDRIPPWIVPVVRRNLAEDGEVRRSALVLAAWAAYVEEADEVVDRRREDLLARAGRQGEDPLAFLDDRDLFGDLRDDERFSQEYAEALASLRERGARATVEEWSAR